MARKNIAEAMKEPEVARSTEIELWPITRLKPHKRNAKQHPPEQITYLAQLIKRHGFDQPIAVDGKGVIIKGHGRWMAAKELGLHTVPVIVRADLAPGLVAEARIADNRVAEFGWDSAQLVADVVDGLKIGLDADVIGFSLKDLGLETDPDTGEVTSTGEPAEDMQGSPVQMPIIEPETPPPPKKPKTKPGQMFQLGEHVLVCGDSTKLEPAFADVDTIFTDPPYGVSYVSRVDEERRKDWGEIKNDSLKPEELIEFLRASVKLAGIKYAFVCCNWQCYTNFEQALGKPKACCVWDKGSFGLGRGYRTQHEFVLFYGTLNRTDLSDVWQFKRDARSDYEHPTQKPVALVAKALTDVGAKVVFDPFGGSGSTLLACEQLGIKCSTIELEPKYCDVIISRWEALTGKKAKVING